MCVYACVRGGGGKGEKWEERERERNRIRGRARELEKQRETERVRGSRESTEARGATAQMCAHLEGFLFLLTALLLQEREALDLVP